MLSMNGASRHWRRQKLSGGCRLRTNARQAKTARSVVPTSPMLSMVLVPRDWPTGGGSPDPGEQRTQIRRNRVGAWARRPRRMNRKSKSKGSPRRLPPGSALEPWAPLQPDAAGLDIGAREIWAAVPPERDPQPVRPFGTFTPDLEALADWLAICRVKSVAMESTGVYWIPIFELLEARGFQVYLVNARHLKNVPSRKTDVLDCQWIQHLHALGLLNASFRPEAEIVVLRAYLRQRAMLIEHRAPHIQHMQKALHQMNVQLTQVLSD